MKKETPINTYGDDDWATPSEEEELKLTFSDWIKRQLTAEQVEDKLKNIQKEESSESVVILTKGTKW
mgnify:CR=1 FL=1